MKDLLRSFYRRSPSDARGSGLVRYERHPDVRTLGECLFSPEVSVEPQVLNEVGQFIWKQLEIPRTEGDIVSALTKEFAVDTRTATADVRPFLDELIAKTFLVAISGSLEPAVTASRPSQSAELLSAAFDRQKAGDWTAALNLCIEAKQDADYPEIVQLDILICRYHLGSVAELASQALSLAPKLPTLARYACWGLAMASAYRADDIGGAKAVACELARQVVDPWDLPTVPTFVYRMGERVIVTEDSAIDSVLEMVQSVQTRCVNTSEESALLEVLAERYRERRAA